MVSKNLLSFLKQFIYFQVMLISILLTIMAAKSKLVQLTFRRQYSVDSMSFDFFHCTKPKLSEWSLHITTMKLIRMDRTVSDSSRHLVGDAAGIWGFGVNFHTRPGLCITKARVVSKLWAQTLCFVKCRLGYTRTVSCFSHSWIGSFVKISCLHFCFCDCNNSIQHWN